jgi:HAD superfamily hydrolase (TIGR01509 family)
VITRLRMVARSLPYYDQVQLVWDMDGTLLDSGVAVPAAYVVTVRTLGGPKVTAADVVGRYWLGVPELILVDLLGRQIESGEADVYYDELAKAEVAPYPDAPGVLDALRARGHPVAIFTGTSSRAANILLADAGLSADVVVGGDLVRRPKPAGDGLALVANRLSVPSTSLAYIGDAPNDMRAARAIGGLAAAAAWGHQYDPAEPADVTLAAPGAALDLLP